MNNDAQKIYMLNALRFKPDGGREQYRKYLCAAGPIVARFGGRKLESYVPVASLIGSFEADLVFFVEWPSWEVFQSFLADPEFQAIRHLREEALDDSWLVRCERPPS